MEPTVTLRKSLVTGLAQYFAEVQPTTPMETM